MASRGNAGGPVFLPVFKSARTCWQLIQSIGYVGQMLLISTLLGPISR
jgi:hypothetical protein